MPTRIMQLKDYIKWQLVQLVSPVLGLEFVSKNVPAIGLHHGLTERDIFYCWFSECCRHDRLFVCNLYIRRHLAVKYTLVLFPPITLKVQLYNILKSPRIR